MFLYLPVWFLLVLEEQRTFLVSPQSQSLLTS